MTKEYDENGKEIVVDEVTEEARTAAFEAIRKKCILVNVVRKQICNIPYDVELGEKVAADYKITDPDFIQVRKFLFNPQHLSEIRSCFNDAVLITWNHTRPWDNMGYRLLPMKYYDDFNEQLSKLKDEFEEAVQTFVNNYDDYVAESKKILGKAFNKKHYPEKKYVKDLFELRIDTMSLPSKDDIRINMSGTELVAMQKDIKDEFQGANETAVQQLIKLAKGTNRPELASRILDVATNIDKSIDSALAMEIAEAKDLIKYVEEEIDTKSMMVMDDIDDDELEELGSDTCTIDAPEECEAELEDDDSDDFGFKEAL